MRPEDLSQLEVPSQPRWSPDGTRHAHVVSTPNVDDDRYDSRIWVDGEPFTAGPNDTTPRWSPDGSHLAFIRTEEDSKPQAMVIPIGGGEAEQVTDFELGVSEIAWSPGGDKLAVVAKTFTDEWSDLEDDEHSRKPRRVTTVPYRFDGSGWTHDRKSHIWLVDLDSEADPHCLTPGSHNEAVIAWSPDGSTIAYITHTAEHLGLESGNEIWEVEVESGDRRQVGALGMYSFVSYDHQGRLHFLGSLDPIYPVDANLHRVEEDGTRNLTGHLDRGNVSLAAGPADIRWDGDDAIVAFEDSGRTELIRVTPDASVEPVVEGQLVITGFDVRDARLIFTATMKYEPTQLYVDGEQMSHHDPGFGVIEGDHFTIESDGFELDVWVYLPEGDEKVPTLLNIHGGPASQYGFGFFDEFQVYAASGYGVVATNPRGSSGKGEKHLNAVRGADWGVVDLMDIRAALEAALSRHERLDTDRMGVMGGSYGGFMTGWIIGQESRWKSAIVERALLSWTSFAGASDIGGAFPHNYLENRYPNAWETWWDKSPLRTVAEVTTPTLIIHSEEDWRCPIEQAEQYFMGLLRNGTTTEFLRFPGEGHELSRSGQPKHRVERFEAILEWHDRHLK